MENKNILVDDLKKKNNPQLFINDLKEIKNIHDKINKILGDNEIGIVEKRNKSFQFKFAKFLFKLLKRNKYCHSMNLYHPLYEKYYDVIYLDIF